MENDGSEEIVDIGDIYVFVVWKSEWDFDCGIDGFVYFNVCRWLVNNFEWVWKMMCYGERGGGKLLRFRVFWYGVDCWYLLKNLVCDWYVGRWGGGIWFYIFV